jgi:hypothetical protein
VRQESRLRNAEQVTLPFLAERKNQMSSKLAFPHFALLEQNLQISYCVRIRANPSRNTKCQPIQLSKIFVSQATEPSHSRWGVRFLIFEEYSKGRETIKNPASSAGPSRPLLPRDGFARCSTVCYPEFVTYLTFGLVFRNSRLPLTTLQI